MVESQSAVFGSPSPDVRNLISTNHEADRPPLLNPDWWIRDPAGISLVKPLGGRSRNWLRHIVCDHLVIINPDASDCNIRALCVIKLSAWTSCLCVLSPCFVSLTVVSNADEDISVWSDYKWKMCAMCALLWILTVKCVSKVFPSLCVARPLM